MHGARRSHAGFQRATRLVLRTAGALSRVLCRMVLGMLGTGMGVALLLRGFVLCRKGPGWVRGSRV